MKRVTTFLFLILFAFALQGQNVLTYQGDVSLMDAGQGFFDVDTESWTAYGSNTIENDAGALKITYVDNSSGAYNYFRETGGLNTDLTIGKTYKIRVRAKRNAGNAILKI